MSSKVEEMPAFPEAGVEEGVGARRGGERARMPAWLTPVLLLSFFLFVYLLTGSSDLKHNGDTDLRYQTTQALVDHHRLWIDHPMWVDTRISRGRGGHEYVFYAPGQILLMAPLYIAGKAIAHHLSLPYDVTTLYAARSLDLFLGALLALAFFMFAESVGYTRRVAAVLTLVFGLATVAWPDAQSGLEQTQVNLLLLIAVSSVWRYIRADLSRQVWLLGAGTAVGIAIFTRYDAALFVPVVGLYPTVIAGRRKGWAKGAVDFCVYAAAIVPWIAGIGLWNYVRLGNVFNTGLRESTWGEPFFTGLAGLLVSPGKGLIWYLPLVFLLPWALPRFYRRAPSLVPFFAVLIMLPLVFYSNLLYWHGDPAWGPRYLYTAVPYLVLPLGELLSAWSRLGSKLRAWTTGIILVSLAVQCAAVSVTQWRFWYRLQAVEEHSSQQFHWGAGYYHYYWNVRESPILVQFDNVYQVLRLSALGTQRYRLTARPTACRPPVRCISNPADNYPLNTLVFWWADVRHPLLGPRSRDAIAATLASGAVLSLALLIACLAWPPTRTGSRRRDSQSNLLTPAEG
ncbi:MAG: hypothetical protein PVSMB7_14630 [Chloroflexota bacterium]